MPAHLRLAVSNGNVLEPSRPVVVELPARPAVTAPPPRMTPQLRAALNLALWLAALVGWLFALALIPE